MRFVRCCLNYFSLNSIGLISDYCLFFVIRFPPKIFILNFIINVQ